MPAAAENPPTGRTLHATGDGPVGPFTTKQDAAGSALTTASDHPMVSWTNFWVSTFGLSAQSAVPASAPSWSLCS